MSNDQVGWIFKGKSNRSKVTREDQLDVYCRNVAWSKTKQMKSVVESNLSVDELFDHFKYEMRHGTTIANGKFSLSCPQPCSLPSAVKTKLMGLLRRFCDSTAQLGLKSLVEEIAQDTNVHFPFQQIEQDTITALRYQTLPMPW